MLIVEIIRYLKRRADRRPVYLKNFVDQGHHHGQRTSESSVAIIIPTRDKVDLLRACVESIFEKTTYKNYSIIVVDNQSVEAGTLEYLDELFKRGVSILKYPHKFNYSAICNFAASTTTAEYLCFLNNDTVVIEPNWLSYMIDHAIQPGVGVVGSKLTYPAGAIQHFGIALGITGVADHWDQNTDNYEKSCFEVSAVTFACAFVKSELWDSNGGLNTDFAVGLNDVDFCLRISSSGYKNIICSRSLLVHVESASRRSTNSARGGLRAFFEILLFFKKWSHNDLKDRYFEKV